MKLGICSVMQAANTAPSPSPGAFFLDFITMSNMKIIPIIAAEAVKARDDRHDDFKTLLNYFTQVIELLDKRVTKLEEIAFREGSTKANA
jgi:hypothetical protein